MASWILLLMGSKSQTAYQEHRPDQSFDIRTRSILMFCFIVFAIQPSKPKWQMYNNILCPAGPKSLAAVNHTHTHKKQPNTSVQEPRQRLASDHQTSRINCTMLQNKSPGQFHGLIQFTTTFSRDIKCFFHETLLNIYMAGVR